MTLKLRAIGTGIACLMFTACGASKPEGAGGKQQGVESGCGRSSWTAGITELCGGRLVYRDYVYDDYGADLGTRTTPISKGTLSRSAGDLRYPAGAENTADLVRLELWLEGDEVVVEFELNTLYEPNQTVAAIALDTDNNPATGGGPWSGLDVSANGWELIHQFNTGDPASNLIRGRFPKPPGEVWIVRAVTAQADGTVMNVAFRGTQEQAGSNASPGGLGNNKGNFWEDRQAAALANGDISEFSAAVRVADLERRVTRGAEVGPGLHQRVYTSAYTLPPGEGISVNGEPGRHGDTGNTCEQYFHYRGKYQPYGIYIPDRAGPHGVQFVMHGCGANHSSLVNQPGMQARFGEELNRIIVVPLGRGPVGWYSDISERDVLDVYADVLANYDVDEDAVIAGGYSMGGYGTLRLAALYPHLFAAAVNWVGFTGDVTNTPGGVVEPQGATAGGIGNVIDFAANLRNVPTVSLYAAADELVQVNTGLAMRERFAQSAVVHDFYMHPNAEHLTFAVLDDWRKEAAYSAGRRRVSNPAHITYRTDESLAYADYGLRHDRAYWISEIRGRDEGYVDLDVKSLGCGLTEPVFEFGNDAGFGPAPLAWERQFRRVNGQTPLPKQNRMEAMLANVRSFSVDLKAACLVPGNLAYSIETDGPVEISFGGRTLNLAGAGKHEGRL